MAKKFPVSHSKIVARKRRTGPVKKNMPATPERPLAPPQPIRTMLHYTGEEFVDKTYDFQMAEMPDIPKVTGQWGADKTGSPSIIGGNGEDALEFPNLPYYIETRPDGSKLKVTQSLTIAKHIARKHGLYVEGEDAVTKMEMYEQQVSDLRTAVSGYCYENPVALWRYPNYIEDIKKLCFTQWEKTLNGKEWIMGDKLTYVDFLFWECIDWHLLMKADFLEGLPNLKAYHQRFKNLPKVKEYFASDSFKEWPLVSPFAKKFGWTR